MNSRGRLWKMSSLITELLECSICLQAYDEHKHSPRVLPCGHTQCLSCLKKLPTHFNDPSSSRDCLIKCPECVQWVKFPALGASALPKNIQFLRLLQLSDSGKRLPETSSKLVQKDCSLEKLVRQSVPQKNQKNFTIDHVFSPPRVSDWISWIIPKDSIVLETSKDDLLSFGRLDFRSSSQHGGKLDVSLLPLATLEISNPSPSSAAFSESNISGVKTTFNRFDGIGKSKETPNSAANLDSYIDLVSKMVASFSQKWKEELIELKRVSLLHRNTSSLIGFWLDNRGLLHLVCERPHRNALEIWDSLGIERDSSDSTPCLARIALEIIEMVIRLHSFGFVFGSLAPECIGFDEFEHPVIDLNRLILANKKMKGFSERKTRETCPASNILTKPWLFSSPEFLCMLFRREEAFGESNATAKLGSESRSGPSFDGVKSDLWSLGCLLLTLLLSRSACNELPFSENLDAGGRSFAFQMKENLLARFHVSPEQASSMRPVEKFRCLLSRCLEEDGNYRPTAFDLWRSLSGWLMNRGESWKNTSKLDNTNSDAFSQILGQSLSFCSSEWMVIREQDIVQGNSRDDKKPLKCTSESASASIDADIPLEEDSNSFQVTMQYDLNIDDCSFSTLEGHLDCVTSLIASGDFLCSASYDKTICVWSLDKNCLIRTLRGHEHRILALAVDTETSRCFSGDYGGRIFVWRFDSLTKQYPVKSWYDHRDWRYSGVHCLAISESGYLYSGSGDRTIKAWCLEDYSLKTVLEGHQSVVSALVISQGLLYSGSWDGTIRLWWLRDHTPLSTLVVPHPTQISNVHAFAVCQGILIASYGDGSVKMWKDDNLLKSLQVHEGAILAMDSQHNWIITGSWDQTIKIVNITKIAEGAVTKVIDCKSIVTSVCFCQGRICIGLANKEIKVLNYACDIPT